MATNIFVPFDLGTLNDQTLKDTGFVRGKLNEAVQAVGARDAEIQRLGNVNAGLQKQFTEVDQQLGTRNTEIASLRKELATQAGRVQELSDKLVKIETTVPRIGVQDLVSQFKGNIDRINADVLTRKTTGMLVDSVEVEVRGGIDVSDGLHITQLPAAALAAESVSVIKFNLKPSSALRIVDEDDDTTR
jgi:TolA-binding protein